ncbi:transposase [uncultured Piscinibacter sp.]|uniref:transposase n=1 Tax=uncultured Piscinibacter sp. TaxID=1131835 RepID=UPI002626D1DC|nr:transposase [uncultured Piscinibacter sp.]
MARLPRLCVPGLPHLVEQSGHNAQPVFLDGVDRGSYRAALARAAVDCGVAIHAYCLEPGRVLLLATPREAEGLSRVMQRVGRRYTAEFNRRHGRSGTLWAGRFRATVLDADSEMVAAMCHVESDAALAGDGAVAAGERISSAAHHLGLAVDPLVTDHARFWALGNTPFERHAAYRLLVTHPLHPEQRRRFDDAVRKGWALGSAAFLAALATSTARRLRPLSPGRPRRRLDRSVDKAVPN